MAKHRAYAPIAQHMPYHLNRSERLAGKPGFEPRLTESESAVLPLNYFPRRLLVGDDITELAGEDKRIVSRFFISYDLRGGLCLVIGISISENGLTFV